MQNSKRYALIVAAGQGSRAGGKVPKQYQPVAGKPLLWWTLQPFLRHPGIAGVRVVIQANAERDYRAAVEGLNLMEPVHGGATRQESVRLGLQSFAQDMPDEVLIHDGARPMVSEALITRVMEALGKTHGVIPVLEVSDTLKKLENGQITGGIDRTQLAQAQTPQGFNYDVILRAHDLHKNKQFTDDAALLEAMKIAVKAVPGDADNIKVTHPYDMERIQARMEKRLETRTGSGFDVHRFIPGDFLTLCGVKIPHSHKLEGHSDADAGLHAVTDALLGAIGEGDIGQHFPPSDPKWKNADSGRFLTHALALLEKRGGRVLHTDLTVICEAPKIGPHRDAMRARLAELLKINSARVSIKATTTEGLGFTGRGEGLAAQALVTIQLPGDL